MKGYIQIYTGEGKGKTTAALGLAIRAAGAGLKVFIAQFIKMGEYSEIKALKRFEDLITVEQFGRGRFIQGKPSLEDIEAAQKGLEKIIAILSSGKHNVVIMEEANVASKPQDVELDITGRGADSRIIEKADLVTEMREIKHYFQKGVAARVGIEK